jgi:demethylmenaquinone methyltransferase/2-methoxy-6-polyprenyl-1,4-benzoquinol methylase
MPAPSQAGPSQPAWTGTELAADPHVAADKADRVRRMFASIARSYDLNNRLHSFGRDQAWRRAAVRLAGVTPGDRVLDVACGTGDLTLAFADAGAKEALGADFTPEMLDLARHKAAATRHANAVRFEAADAMNLPYDDRTFDIVSIAFGIRNVHDPHRALRELRRVLRPGGRLIVLEFSRPANRVVRAVNDLYCRHVLPRTATFIARDRSGAYRYLPRSIETFLDPGDIRAAMISAGLVAPVTESLTFGVCAVTRAIRPAQQ